MFSSCTVWWFDKDPDLGVPLGKRQTPHSVGMAPSLMITILSSGDLLSLRGILALNDAPTAVVFRCTHSCLSIPMVARPLNVRPGFSEVYDKHEVEGLADWVGGCRGGILGVEGDTPYLIRQ